jgi:predicted regulator of Ras-like GTPase activity (Roadblock/LC7/MglB family)
LFSLFRLLNSDGALLAFSGFHNKDARITSAIASNVWSAYEKHGHNSFREDPLQYLIINCEGGNVIVTQVSILLPDSLF